MAKVQTRPPFVFKGRIPVGVLFLPELLSRILTQRGIRTIF